MPGAPKAAGRCPAHTTPQIRIDARSCVNVAVLCASCMILKQTWQLLQITMVEKLDESAQVLATLQGPSLSSATPLREG